MDSLLDSLGRPNTEHAERNPKTYIERICVSSANERATALVRATSCCSIVASYVYVRMRRRVAAAAKRMMKKKSGSKKRRKLNVLCLHGWRTNGDILRMQLRDVIRDNREDVGFTFINAPFKAKGPPQDIVGKIWPPDKFKYYEWWDRVDDRYEGLERSIQYIVQANEEYGPFQGILGFSQGAALASIVCKKKILDTLYFGALFSGFVPRDRDLRVLFSKKSDSNVPLFLSAGERDADYCKKALQDFPKTFAKDSCVVANHSGGHELPLKTNGGSGALLSLRSFISEVGCTRKEEGTHRGKI